ncbi:uncharacterized protein PpBr36_09699 [Pyricularia pennisetigena]|uniref:uncharacterized protein n=1 Tax=Pyricularia pennisetigena TaxID=1578925 RepID=UPI001150D428|nr:uncharacterized protein PpBr36_09699 [Pyricularia pennisetigena]TLS22334.1 hypothetical protein PpBr36_09699 [Pyricularia pennisetigena]
MGKRKTEEANGVEATSKKRRRDEAEAENVEVIDAAKAEKKRLKKEKKDKRKAEDAAVNDEEGADNQEQKKKKDKKQKKEKKAKEEEVEDAAPVVDAAESDKKKEKKKDKKDKKSKKESKSKSEDGAADGQGDEAKPKTKRKRDAEETDGVDDTQAAGDGKPDKKKSKDGKKSKKSSKESAGDKNNAAEAMTMTPSGDAQEGEQDGDDEEQQQAGGGGKNTRFIVFVGNLPFTATKEHIAAHFASLKPTSVRLLTDRNDPKKSRGIAFVEFDNYSHMKTCLAKMHHSEFEDGLSAPRKINVELTAGGGGKTPFRKEKIRAKNDKLREERARRMKAELEAKHKEDEQDGIHPSRRAQMHRNQQAGTQ